MKQLLSPARAAQRRKRLAELRIDLITTRIALEGFTAVLVARFHRSIRKHYAAMDALDRACRAR